MPAPSQIHRATPPAGLVHVLAAALAAAALLAAARPLGAQGAVQPGTLARIHALQTERLEVDRVSVIYSSHAETGAAGDEAEAARRVAERFVAASEFFARELDGDFRFTLALLSPRDWSRVGGGVHAIPWHSQADQLVVVPVQPDMELLLGGPDSTQARKVLDVVALHQLGHVVTAAFFHPAGYRASQPPVRWFDELLASYLATWYMRSEEPELADFVVSLARDVMARTEPRFSSLAQYDEYYDGFLTSPGGANTLGWYQNAFNLRAARLYDRLGPRFAERVSELPWRRLEAWTSEQLLDELNAVSPDFPSWAEEMEALTRTKYW